jgi:hypothetical protein
MTDFPTRGFSLIQPTVAETQLTGWLATVQFSRLGHEYAIKFRNLRQPECLRDGKPIDWYKLNSKAQAVAHKAADWLNAAAKVAA